MLECFISPQTKTQDMSEYYKFALGRGCNLCLGIASILLQPYENMLENLSILCLLERTVSQNLLECISTLCSGKAKRTSRILHAFIAASSPAFWSAFTQVRVIRARHCVEKFDNMLLTRATRTSPNKGDQSTESEARSISYTNPHGKSSTRVRTGNERCLVQERHRPKRLRWEESMVGN